MSQERSLFENAAKSGRWDEAFKWCNSLNMWEMLDSIAKLPDPTRRNFHAQAFRYFGKFNVLRIEFAFMVATRRVIPSPVGKEVDPQDDVGGARDWLQSTAPTLSFDAKAFAQDRYRGCGGFSRAVVWKLQGLLGTNFTTGYIVQKVKNTFNLADASGNVIGNSSQTYWEAWKVIDGVINPTWSFIRLSLEPGDVFTMDKTPGLKGEKLKEGWAKYLEGYSDPDKWGQEAKAQAGDIPSTNKEPGPPWTEKGAIYRWYKVVFDCTNGKSSSVLTSWDNDSREQIES